MDVFGDCFFKTKVINVPEKTMTFLAYWPSQVVQTSHEDCLY